jgi:formyl-CoA transferase/CoA:oxalate CoA-transferase
MASDVFATGNPPQRLGNRHATIVPYQLFKARDKHILIAVANPTLWNRFCDALGFGAELRDHPRFAANPDRVKHHEELVTIIESKLSTEDASWWLDKLRQAEIPSGQINTLSETLNDPQIRHRGMIVELEHPMGPLKVLGSPLHLSDSPLSYRRCPPLLGQHTHEVLDELHIRRDSAVSGVHERVAPNLGRSDEPVIRYK